MNTTLPNLCQYNGLMNSVIHPGFCVGEIPLGGVVKKPRTIRSLSKNQFVILNQGTGSVVLVQKVNDTAFDHLSESWENRTLVSESSLSHGLVVVNNTIYASSPDFVYRWNYTNTESNNFTSIGPSETIIRNINANAVGVSLIGHWTRTLVFDKRGRLYVSVGSVLNVDLNSYRSRIRRFTLNPPYPIDFTTGTVFADGLRNEVGLAFDNYDVLWGVENGADKLNRATLGGDISADNPAEELNRFPESNRGKHYGYPYCFTEYKIPKPYGLGRGTIWAWPSFRTSGRITDRRCRSNRFVKPIVAMQGHSAPLGIVFYKYKTDRPEYCQSIIPFPSSMDGYAFIAFHGSWNRQIPTGYKVVYVPITYNTNTGHVLSTQQPIDLLAHIPPNAPWEDGFRPVDVTFDECGRLLISSDGTDASRGSKIVRIEATSTQLMKQP